MKDEIVRQKIKIVEVAIKTAEEIIPTSQFLNFGRGDWGMPEMLAANSVMLEVIEHLLDRIEKLESVIGGVTNEDNTNARE